jgi:2-isopropylmalate synthase
MDAGARELIYDWNRAAPPPFSPPRPPAVFDETLRDGLQSPSAKDPDVGAKIELVQCMDALGIEGVNLGFLASSKRAYDDAVLVCRAIAEGHSQIRPACAARTLASDVEPILRLREATGVAVEAHLFIGSSPIRQLAEDWDIDVLVERSESAIGFAVERGLTVTYVTEDTTRSRPDTLSKLFEVAVRSGATRFCLADTVGHATPDGVALLVGFTRAQLERLGGGVTIDWHGHDDTGRALENALSALLHGADRAHATALGIGERVGNTPMELLLYNMKRLGWLERDLTGLAGYCERASRALDWPIAPSHPLVGRDAFRTATGVHAAAINKALSRGDRWTADRVYSAVPASEVGRRQEICVGFMSGASNVVRFLGDRGIEATPALVRAVLERAKASRSVLDTDEVLAVVASVRGT